MTTQTCIRRPGATDTACRCSEECRRLSAEAQHRRYLRAAKGLPRRVPAVRVAKHIRSLLLRHPLATIGDVAQAAGVSRRTLGMLLADVETDPTRTVNARTAYKVLAVTTIGLAPHRRLDATGTRRRIEALCTLGWSASYLAERIGVPRQSLWPAKLTGTVRASVAADVTRLYEQHRWTTGPDANVAAKARTLGYAPPSAWNRNIDDPKAVPHVTDLHPPRWREAIISRHRSTLRRTA